MVEDGAVMDAGYATWSERPYADAVVGRGRELLAAGEAAAAVAACDHALRHYAYDARALCLKSIALARLGRYDEALAAATRAIYGDTALGSGYAARAAVLAALGREQEAAADLAYAEEFMSLCGLALFEVACGWSRLGRMGECRRVLGRSLDVAPGLAARMPVEEALERYRDEPWFRELSGRH